MKRMIFLLYGAIAYLFFLGTILYAIGFAGNLFVPKSIDGAPTLPLAQALLINALLLLLFALQHSIMARPAFKKWWTKIIPEPLERSTYVMLASLCLTLLMWQWQPVGGIIWSVRSGAIKTILLIAYFIGWTVVFFSTFLINHFDLFGLRQVWLNFLDKPYTHLPFRTPLLYRWVRHPLYFGLLLAFWSAPVMTVSHLLFAVLTTGYIFTAIQLEEKDLIKTFDQKYHTYKRQVPMILPFKKARSRSSKQNSFEIDLHNLL